MIELRRGDIFCTDNPSVLGKGIVAVESIWSKNGAKYGHTGFVTDPDGITLEALWTIRGNHLDAYLGRHLILGRWDGMTEEGFWRGMQAVAPMIDRPYPFYRLLFFLIPPLARIHTGEFGVCSELQKRHEQAAGNVSVTDWHGWTPDDVADNLIEHKGYTVLFEGIWKGKE